MPRSFDRHAGTQVDEWTIETPLGSGGNAEVWIASRTSGERCALKLLRQRNAESEPYRRMVAEVEAMKRIGTHRGTLSLIAYSLPPRPTKEKPAWIATPVARPINQALDSEAKLREVVVAIRSIASTLGDLQHRLGIHHRDIKPANLYELDGDWVVGDFGLVAFPDKESITSADRHIGPVYYLAPELLSGRASIEPGPADVYALGVKAKDVVHRNAGQREAGGRPPRALCGRSKL
jgi:serine/threonine protein kinase